MQLAPQDHDGFFKIWIDDNGTIRVLLQHWLPAPLYQSIDQTVDPEVLMVNYAGLYHGPSHADFLIRLKTTDGTPLHVYVLFEHKSHFDRNTPMQLLIYQGEELRAIFTKQGESGPLPAIFCVVVYHGPEPWSMPPFFHTMYGPLSAELRSYVLDFPYQLLNLQQIPDQEILLMPLRTSSGLMAL
ncbi:MAG: Rpn family recombination-promoting nuclease/putative transposase, partial [Magnetococcales bacterium]|nr:Rpn family recombination-promoting nuclease/putative transposase [Magnetococcales bacterium]